jgi:hypothetical protein
MFCALATPIRWGEPGKGSLARRTYPIPLALALDAPGDTLGDTLLRQRPGPERAKTNVTSADFGSLCTSSQTQPFDQADNTYLSVALSVIINAFKR